MVDLSTPKIAVKNEIIAGLSSIPKKINSWYFYDDEGSRLFEAITHLEEYYLTRVETEIFQKYGSSMANMFSRNSNRFFNLVELGAGDGIKTKLLLQQLQIDKTPYLYSPIDISGEALRMLEKNILRQIPSLKINKMQGDYFKQLDAISRLNHGPKVILFLGSSIGNYSNHAAIDFLKQIRNVMGTSDRLMIGFDLVKDSEVILNAYNDASGITRDFNLNLLRRMNAEFGANFNLESFQHCAVYDPIRQAALSYLVSTKDQEVLIEATGQIISFDAWETIHTETSQKYTRDSISLLAKQSGFKVKQWYTDEKKYFADVVFELDETFAGGNVN